MHTHADNIYTENKQKKNMKKIASKVTRVKKRKKTHTHTHSTMGRAIIGSIRTVDSEITR